MITFYQRSSLTCYSIWKTRWRVALLCRSLDDVYFIHGLCLRAAEPLAVVAGLQWRTSAKEFVSFAYNLYPNGDQLSSCAYYHLNILSKESKSSHQTQSWSTLPKRSRSASWKEEYHFYEKTLMFSSIETEMARTQST
jgi:hypothetical protein